MNPSSYISTLSLLILSGLSIQGVAQPDRRSEQKPFSAKSSIAIHQVLGSGYACAIAGSVQFLGEDKLLVLTGPTEDCHRSVNQLELVVFSLDGRVLKRKRWPSTYPVIVLSADRIATNDLDQINVLDANFEKVEAVSLPPHDHPFTPFLYPSAAGKVAVRIGSKTYEYGGSPLADTGGDAVPRRLDDGTELIQTFSDGRKLIRSANVVTESNGDSRSRRVADLGWVIPCQNYCQAYDAGQFFRATSGAKRRLLVASNGSRIPVTDAAGLFPYFRVQVFDVDDGRELYRVEQITHTGKRWAAISPDGDMVVVCDPNELVIHRLKD